MSGLSCRCLLGGLASGLSCRCLLLGGLASGLSCRRFLGGLASESACSSLGGLMSGLALRALLGGLSSGLSCRCFLGGLTSGLSCRGLVVLALPTTGMSPTIVGTSSQASVRAPACSFWTCRIALSASSGFATTGASAAKGNR